MKKYNTALLGIIAVIMFAFNICETQAQCPPGWTATSRDYEFAPDCSVKVYFCFKCGVTGANPANIRVTDWDVTLSTGCPSPLDIPDSWFITQFSNEYLNICATPPPPCGQGCIDFLIEIPTCRQWYYNQVPPPVPPPPFRSFFTWNQPCVDNERWCQTILQVCYDSSLGRVVECGPRISNIYGPDCEVTSPISPPTYPQTPGMEVPYSDCFDGGCGD